MARSAWGLDLPEGDPGNDSPCQRRVPVMIDSMTMASADRKGRRKVRMAVGGRAVGEVKTDRTWRAYGNNFPDGRDRTGSASTFKACLDEMARVM